ncbi:FMN-dependent NADH-azoreductase [Photobacterium jeanii]|uniref:FMN dependent NADH:quinone oxidoreductase n=1 Tax=Photobacterium jeanii TaxID=858640 RepID=A0A178KKZ2_9GAMM|nr:FMN-dependent NADH-azoreductase [Photobacterium jeanii]OAN17786.1 FMN-dependent NADH-azoreductase [Photobacterium jeanii]PST92548.1 FMN-dependent NADH-azoreductase [Photobacterium jeanii]
MAKVLVLKSSILGDYSQSNALVDHLLNQWEGKTDAIIERDLVSSPLPMLDGQVANALRGGDQLSEEQQSVLALSDQLIDEIKASDTIIMAAPMYNFMVPTQLKNWFDLIARAGVTFSYTETGPVGLLTDKKVIVVTTRGGIHKDAPSDTLTPYLRNMLGFVGMTDVNFIYGEALAMGDEMASQSLNSAKQALAEINA